MARILITGSSDGLGLMAARLLARQGHAVTLHARDETAHTSPRPPSPPPDLEGIPCPRQC